MLPVLLFELNGGSQRVLREQTGAVEIIESVVAVIPATDIAVVLQGMTDHALQLVARMAVLCSSVTDGYALRRAGHGMDVKRKAVGMALAESPHLIGYLRYIFILNRTVVVRACSQD